MSLKGGPGDGRSQVAADVHKIKTRLISRNLRIGARLAHFVSHHHVRTRIIIVNMARRSLCVLTTELPTTESPELNKALSVILGLPENELADALVKCRDKGCLTLLGDDVKIAQQYNKAEPTIPVADWEDIAGQHGVPLSFMALNGDLKHHSLTPCYPPPSFHYALFQSAWHALDTFDDLGQQIGEGARVRTLEPVRSHIPIRRQFLSFFTSVYTGCRVDLSSTNHCSS